MKSHKCLNICSYNPRTINDLNTHALDTMLYEISNIKWDIIGFSETKETKIESLDDSGYKIYLSSNDLSRSNGVAFLVNKSYIPAVEDYDPNSDRLAFLSMKGKFSC